MQSKNTAFRLVVSLSAVAIVVPLVSTVNHFTKSSKSQVNSIELKADGNPMPPVPPPKNGPHKAMPPVPPPPGLKAGAVVLVADGNPMPPVPPPKNGPHKAAEVLSADGNPMPPVPPPPGFSADLSVLA